MKKTKRILAFVLAFIIAFYSVPVWTVEAENIEMQSEEKQSQEQEEKRVIVVGTEYGTVTAIEFENPDAPDEDGESKERDKNGYAIKEDAYYKFIATPKTGTGYLKGTDGITLNDDDKDGVYESNQLHGIDIQNESKIIFASTETSIVITNENPQFGTVSVAKVSDGSVIDPKVDGSMSTYKTNINERYKITLTPNTDCDVEDLPNGFTRVGDTNEYQYITQNGEYSCGVKFVHKPVNVNISYSGQGMVYIYGQDTEITNNQTIEVEYQKDLTLLIQPAGGYYLEQINGQDIQNVANVTPLSSSNGYTYALGKMTENTNVEIVFQTNVHEQASTLSDAGLIISASSGNVIEDSSNPEYMLYILPRGTIGTISALNGKKININNEKSFNYYRYNLNHIVQNTKIILSSSINDENHIEIDYVPNIVVLSENNAPSMSFEGNWNNNSTWISDFTKEFTFSGTVWDNGEQMGEKEYKAGISKLVFSTSPLDNPINESTVVNVNPDGRFEFKLDEIPSEDTTYYFYPIDRAGNYTTYTQTLKVDKELPKITSVVVNPTDYAINSADSVAYTNKNRTSVEVIVTDENGAGVNTISLYKDGVLLETKRAIEGINKYVFNDLNIDKDANNSFSAVASDKVGHEIQYENRKKATPNKIIYDVAEPKIDLDLVGLFKSENNDNVIYYINEKQQTKYDLNISLDNEGTKSASGIESVRVCINGVELIKDADGKEFKLDSKKKHTQLKYKILLSGCDEYVVEIFVSTVSGQYVNKSYVLKKDVSSPIWVENSGNITGGVAELGLDMTTSNMDQYGFFGSDYMCYSFNMSDSDSGMKSITYYYSEPEGKVSSTKNTVAMQGDKGEQVSGEIIFPEDSKGFLHLIATDNVENSSVEYMTAGFITESEEKHKEESSITFSSQNAAVKDAYGNNLYSAATNVEVIVSDEWSGIRQIEWSVEVPNDSSANTYGNVEVASDMNLYGNTNGIEWSKMETSHNLVTKMNAIIPINASSNDIVVTVTLTDRVGNKSTESYLLSIDTTAPKVSITFNNNNARMNNIYNEDRIATVVVTDRNFDADGVNMIIKAASGSNVSISDWTEILDENNPDNNTYIATVSFTEDDDYQFSIICKDKAGNSTDEVSVEPFSIDKTAPIITVELDGSSRNENYYSTNRTATITVNEHYFDEGSIVISSAASNAGNAIAFPMLSGWTTNGDVHIATITFTEDGLYSFTVSGTDMAGNIATESIINEFCIDKTMPVIEISGVENNSANNGIVAPVINFTDLNYDSNGTNITLTGANSGVVKANGKYSNITDGQTFTFENFEETKETDDIYTLTASAIDKAGNLFEQSITFSVNRFGSVYVFDDTLKKNSGKYVNKAFDVTFTETNADAIDMGTVKLTVSANGSPKDLIPGNDYSVVESGGNGSWSQYTYTIDKTLFEADGTYIVTIYSVDEAGNINENIDETKNAEIEFGIDTIAPVIVPINIEENSDYTADKYEAKVSVVDNLVLSDVAVNIDKTDADVLENGETFTFVIPEANTQQNIMVMAYDAAGNKATCNLSGVLVSTNVIARYMNNMPVMAATTCGAVVIGGAIAVIVVTRRRGIVRVRTSK